MSPITMSVVVAFLWGLSVVIHKHAIQRVGPHMVLVLTAALFAPCILAYAVAHRAELRRQADRLTAETLAWIAFSAVVTSFLSRVLYMHALQQHHSHVVAAISFSAPLFTTLLAYAFLREPVTPLAVAGVALVVAGTACLVAGGGRGGSAA